jgi:hypothetical protein
MRRDAPARVGRMSISLMLPYAAVCSRILNMRKGAMCMHVYSAFLIFFPRIIIFSVVTWADEATQGAQPLEQVTYAHVC